MKNFLALVLVTKCLLFVLIHGRFVKIQPLPERLVPPKSDDSVKFNMINTLKDNSTSSRNETIEQGRYYTENIFDDFFKMMILKNAFSALNIPGLKDLQDNKVDLNTGENLRYFGNHFTEGFGSGGGGGGYGGGNPLMPTVPYMFGGDFSGGTNNPMMSSLFLMGTLAFVTFLINSILGLVGKLRLPLFGTRNGIDEEKRLLHVFESDPRNSKMLMEMEQKIKEAIAQQEEKNGKIQ
ncbi:hypothetical protein DMENIID0001_050040 [Sergentomyia squamirostris]